MVWNNIADGDPGLASTAMQNWRHAGRFAGDMVPMDTNGITLTTGLLNLGTAAAPWANLYVATAGSIYVGGSPFAGGSGGGDVETYELKSHIEKMGFNYPVTNAQNISESFMNSAAMLLTMGKSQEIADTSIYLDRDASTISVISQASATAWTPINTGTTATNTTAGQYVLTCSVKHAVTNATNTSYFMACSFTSFSLVDRNLKVWLYPDTKSNLTAALVRLECATTTVYCEFQIPVASITAATLNSLVLNMDSPDTTTASFSRGAITRVYLGTKGSATPQTFNWSWNYLRSVDNRALKLPCQFVADNGTNQEFINLTTATVSGDLYTLAASTTYAHSLTTSQIALKQLDVASGMGVIGSGTAGEAAKTGWDISRFYMNTTTTGDLILSSRWYDESYQVATLTNASTTVLSITTSTVKDGFKSGDVVRLYKWEYIDQNYQSPKNGSIGSNFLDLTLTADATATSALLTLVHAGTSNQNLGGDSVTKWRGVRVSADDYYRVELDSQSQSLVKATPTVFIPQNDGIPYTTYIHSYWPLNEGFGGNALNKKLTGGTYDITQVGTVPYSSDGKPTGNGSRGPFTTANYFTNTGGTSAYEASTFIISGWLKTSSTGVEQGIFTHWNGSNNGYCLRVTTTSKVNMTFAGVVNDICVSTQDVNSGIWVHFSFAVLATSGANNARLYINGALSSQASGAAISTAGPLSGSPVLIGNYTPGASPFLGTLCNIVYSNTVPSTWAEFETNLAREYALGVGKVYGTSIGYSQKTTISAVTGNKLITATRLTRQDATNQIPKIFQRNAIIL